MAENQPTTSGENELLSHERLKELLDDTQDEHLRMTERGGVNECYEFTTKEALSIITELLARRGMGTVRAWEHVPTGNVFKPNDYSALLLVWQEQFSETHSPEEIAADFVPLYAALGAAP